MTVFYISMLLKVNLCLLPAAFFIEAEYFCNLNILILYTVYIYILSFYSFHYLDYFKIHETAQTKIRFNHMHDWRCTNIADFGGHSQLHLYIEKTKKQKRNLCNKQAWLSFAPQISAALCIILFQNKDFIHRIFVIYVLNISNSSLKN